MEEHFSKGSVFVIKNIADVEGCCLMKPKALKAQLISFRGILTISVVTSGAPRAKRASGAPWVNKSTHPRKFGNHVTDRPTDRSHHRLTNVYSYTF